MYLLLLIKLLLLLNSSCIFYYLLLIQPAVTISFSFFFYKKSKIDRPPIILTDRKTLKLMLSSASSVLSFVVVGPVRSALARKPSPEPILFTLSSSLSSVLYYAVIVVWWGRLTAEWSPARRRNRTPHNIFTVGMFRRLVHANWFQCYCRNWPLPVDIFSILGIHIHIQNPCFSLAAVFMRRFPHFLSWCAKNNG